MTALAIERKTCFCRLRGCFRHARQLNPYPSTAAAAFPAARLLVVLDLPSVAAQPDDPVPLDVFSFFVDLVVILVCEPIHAFEAELLKTEKGLVSVY
jgi:hypothetical protein